MKDELSERLKALGDKLRRAKELLNSGKVGEAELLRARQLLNSINHERLSEGVAPQDDDGGDPPDSPPPVSPGQGPGGN